MRPKSAADVLAAFHLWVAQTPMSEWRKAFDYFAGGYLAGQRAGREDVLAILDALGPEELRADGGPDAEALRALGAAFLTAAIHRVRTRLAETDPPTDAPRPPLVDLD